MSRMTFVSNVSAMILVRQCFRRLTTNQDPLLFASTPLWSFLQHVARAVDDTFLPPSRGMGGSCVTDAKCLSIHLIPCGLPMPVLRILSHLHPSASLASVRSAPVLDEAVAMRALVYGLFAHPRPGPSSDTLFVFVVDRASEARFAHARVVAQRGVTVAQF